MLSSVVASPFLTVTVATAMMSETARVEPEIAVISSFNTSDLFLLLLLLQSKDRWVREKCPPLF